MHPLTLRDITKHPRIAVLIVDAFGGVMVRRREFALTAKQVEKLAEPGRYGDGGGLYLQVLPTGAKTWVFRFMLNKRAREMGLGGVTTFSLAEARERARAARQLLADGFDPMRQGARMRYSAAWPTPASPHSTRPPNAT